MVAGLSDGIKLVELFGGEVGLLDRRRLGVVDGGLGRWRCTGSARGGRGDAEVLGSVQQ